MDLVKFRTQDDFGKDFYLTLIQIKGWCMIQSCFSIMQFSRSWPYLNITLGSGRLFGVSFQVWTFGITIEFFTRSWFK